MMERAGEVGYLLSGLRWQDVAFVYFVWMLLRWCESWATFVVVGLVSWLGRIFFPDREF